MKRTATWIVLVLIIVFGVALLWRAQTAAKESVASHDFDLDTFGIALPLPQDLSDIRAVAADESAKGPGTVYHLYAGDGCDLAAIYEIKKNAIAKSNTTWTEATLNQFAFSIGDKPPQVKEFTDFYLVFEPNPKMCAADDKGKQLESKQQGEIWGAISGAHYMQS